MKRCKNCNALIRDNDRYCRNCGICIPNNFVILLLNLFTVIMVIGIIFLILLFIASYVVE